MWNCNWGIPYHYGGWFVSHGIFGWLLNVLIMFIFIYIIFRIITALLPKKNTRQGAPDPLHTLKARLASGEINEEEYRKMKDILSR